ncbi:hypothetical protein COBT_001826, partial [Conglomerata obtusa]
VELAYDESTKLLKIIILQDFPGFFDIVLFNFDIVLSNFDDVICYFDIVTRNFDKKIKN